jgi:hypothetical protein
MIGHDVSAADPWEWRRLAAFFAEAQLRLIHDAALQVLSSARVADEAPLIGAGSGHFVLRRLAERLGRPYVAWEAAVPVHRHAARMAGICAPATAVALLLAMAHGSPP